MTTSALDFLRRLDALVLGALVEQLSDGAAGEILLRLPLDAITCRLCGRPRPRGSSGPPQTGVLTKTTIFPDGGVLVEID